jgi:hypothetical protein
MFFHSFYSSPRKNGQSDESLLLYYLAATGGEDSSAGDGTRAATPPASGEGRRTGLLSLDNATPSVLFTNDFQPFLALFQAFAVTLSHSMFCTVVIPNRNFSFHRALSCSENAGRGGWLMGSDVGRGGEGASEVSWEAKVWRSDWRC